MRRAPPQRAVRARRARRRGPSLRRSGRRWRGRARRRWPRCRRRSAYVRGRASRAGRRGRAGGGRMRGGRARGPGDGARRWSRSRPYPRATTTSPGHEPCPRRTACRGRSNRPSGRPRRSSGRCHLPGRFPRRARGRAPSVPPPPSSTSGAGASPLSISCRRDRPRARCPARGDARESHPLRGSPCDAAPRCVRRWPTRSRRR